jgi:hypothetical protein
VLVCNGKTYIFYKNILEKIISSTFNSNNIHAIIINVEGACYIKS